MSTYTRKRCPACGSIIQNWHKDNEHWRTHIRPAVELCPMCNRHIRRSPNVEFIMLKNPKLFIAKYLFVDAIKSILFGVGFGGIAWCFLDKYGIGLELSTLFAIVALFILHCLSLKRAVENSITRTSSYEYCAVLREMGLITESQMKAACKGSR